MKTRLLPAFVLLLVSLNLAAQLSTRPNSSYHRVVGLVHLTGSGKPGDPIRPDFVPATASRDRAGIIAWSLQLTDDKKMAIVQYVAASRAALDPVIADKRADTRIFEIGKHSRQAIETEMRKHKKDFNLETLAVGGK